MSAENPNIEIAKIDDLDPRTIATALNAWFKPFPYSEDSGVIGGETQDDGYLLVMTKRLDKDGKRFGPIIQTFHEAKPEILVSAGVAINHDSGHVAFLYNPMEPEIGALLLSRERIVKTLAGVISVFPEFNRIFTASVAQLETVLTQEHVARHLN